MTTKLETGDAIFQTYEIYTEDNEFVATVTYIAHIRKTVHHIGEVKLFDVPANGLIPINISDPTIKRLEKAE